MIPSELALVIEQSILNSLNLLVVGPPGSGKTDIVKQVLSKIAWKLLIFHPVISDPTDFKGLPFLVCTDPLNPEAKFVPFNDLKLLIEADEPTVAFFDDSGQAPPAVQAAMMQVITGQIGGHRVSEHVRFVAATNRRSDQANVRSMLEPLKSRFQTIVELDPGDPRYIRDWTDWAINNGIKEEVIHFVNFKPKMLFDFKPTPEIVNSPCPRTVFHASNQAKLPYPENVRKEVLIGAAGEAWGREYIPFERQFQDLPNINEILENPDNAKVPEEVSTLHMTCAAVARRVNRDNFGNIIKYLERVATNRFEMAAFALKMCVRSDENLKETSGYIAWMVNHKEQYK
jgi:hypothetical protein